MSVAYVIEFWVRAPERERFLNLLGGVIAAMQSEPTHLGHTFHVDPADPLHFLLHEVWQDHGEVVAVQLGRPYRQEWHAALPELVAKDRLVTVWEPMGNTVAGIAGMAASP
ncbi:putative quinol monooxygenase [Jiella pacifica]|uniref:Antibiotic biosynthesis monooxygenase n=1 Tax=Jiella pacifica TaxID=2696469 RepID=A0A6N9T4I7_9HYPH|nr:putative quinol monooxygenase [Jiella pacifica]NDW06283.1 antibiotic biosynthesis monooxygenase [Jiella pacifica]